MIGRRYFLGNLEIVMISRLTIFCSLGFLVSCQGSKSSGGSSSSSTPSPTTTTTTTSQTSDPKVVNKPYDFSSTISFDGKDAPDTSGKVGSTVHCAGVTGTPSGVPLTYKIIWTSRAKVPGKIDWQYTDISDVFVSSDGVIPQSLAHKEISCQIKAISQTLDETLSVASPYFKVINSDPAPFAVTVSGTRDQTDPDWATLSRDGYDSFTLAGDQLGCLGATTDLDLDPVIYTTSWQVKTLDSTDWETVSSLASVSVVKDRFGRELRCQMTAYDSAGGIQTSYSKKVYISNRPPLDFSSVVAKFVSGQITAVQPADEFLVGDNLTCFGQTTDPDQTSTLSYSYEWLASVDSSFSSPVSLALTKDYQVSSSAAHKYISCVVTAKDDFGTPKKSTGNPSYHIKNSVPSDFASSIEGDLHTGSRVKCTSSPNDLDQDTLTPSYLWFLAIDQTGLGLSQTGESTNELLVTSDMVGKYLRCMTVVDDSHGGQKTSTPSSFRPVLRTLPTVGKAQVLVQTILPAAVGSDLNCSADVKSPDLSPLSISYTWQKSSIEGGGFVSVTTSDVTSNSGVGSSQTNTPIQASTIHITPSLAHMFLRCLVSASDQSLVVVTGDPSDLVHVVNTPPSSQGFIAKISPDPSEPNLNLRVLHVGEDFICDAKTTDIDLDPLTYTRTWRVTRIRPDLSLAGDPVDIRSILGSSSPDPIKTTFTVSKALAHSKLSCMVTVDDLHENGSISSDYSQQVTVDNLAPLPFVQSLPDNALFSNVLRCENNTTDPDGDELTYVGRFKIVKPDQTIWYSDVDGHETNKTSWTVTSNEVGDQIYCERRASDGWGGVTTSVAGPTTIQNSPPLPFSAMLVTSSTTNDVHVGDTITCSGATLDPDDTLGSSNLSYSARFLEVDSSGAVISTLNNVDYTSWSNVLVNGNFVLSHLVTSDDAHKNIGCEIKAKDLYGAEQVSAKSVILPVLNTPPPSFSSTISGPSHVFVGNDVTCGEDQDVVDVDADTILTTYKWYKAANVLDPNPTFTELFGLTGKTIKVPSILGHSLFRCVSIKDDQHQGVTIGAFSNSIQVENSAPEKILSKVIRISAPEALLPQITSNQYGYDSTVSCEEDSIHSDKDLDQVAVDSYVWGYKDDSGSFIEEPLMGTLKTFHITDVTRQKIVHRDIACKIIAVDEMPSFVTWDQPIKTIGDFGKALSYLNAPPSDFDVTMTLKSSPTYFDALKMTTIDMSGKLAVGSHVLCSGSTVDLDNGGLVGGSQPDPVTVTYKLQKKVASNIFGQFFTSWVDLPNLSDPLSNGSDQTVTSEASHQTIRCVATAKDPLLAVTISSTTGESEVVNTPPIVTKAPGQQNPAKIFEDSILSIPGSTNGINIELEVMDPDGDTVTWSSPGTPSGASWAVKSIVSKSATSQKIYDISTKPNPAAGSDGYDYATLATPETLDLAHFKASASDGFDSSSGDIYYSVLNVDRPPVISGYKISRQLADGTVRQFSPGEQVILSEFKASSISSATGADSGCGANPNDTPEFYSASPGVSGNGDMDISITNPSLLKVAQNSVAQIFIELNYTDPDGDELSLSNSGQTKVTYALSDLKDPGHLHKNEVITSGINLSQLAPNKLKFSISSCDVVPHTKEFSERNADGSVKSFYEVNNSSNSITGHYRRKWAAELLASIEYVTKVTGAHLGNINIPIKVLDVDRLPAVQWYSTSTQDINSWSPMTVGGNIFVPEPYTPSIGWTLSRDPDGDDVEAFEVPANFLRSSTGIIALPSGSDYNPNQHYDPTIYDYTYHVTNGIFSTKDIPTNGVSGYLPTYWITWLSYIGTGNGNFPTGYSSINSSSPDATIGFHSNVYGFNLTKSICETNDTFLTLPYANNANEDPLEKTCVGVSDNDRVIDYNERVADDRSNILIPGPSTDEIIGSAGVSSYIQNTPQCAQYTRQCVSSSPLFYGTYCASVGTVICFGYDCFVGRPNIINNIDFGDCFPASPMLKNVPSSQQVCNAYADVCTSTY
jgi:hypothetical protein